MLKTEKICTRRICVLHLALRQNHTKWQGPSKIAQQDKKIKHELG